MRSFPDHFTFQWHITEQCNNRCRHCYQNEYSDKGLSMDNIAKVLENIVSFISDASNAHSKKVKAHINYTGGEPFLREDILDIIKHTMSFKMFEFAILSNGYLIDDEKIARLKTYDPKFIQISLEGNKKVNNKIRGPQSYDKIIKACKHYKQFNIPVIISFTANKENYKYFSQIVDIARKYGVKKVWTDRYLPVNRNDKIMMNIDETKAFFQSISKAQKKYKYKKSDIMISSKRALQFLTAGRLPYKCSAGDSLLAIMANGDLLPCRRMPVKVGNLLQDSLSELYYNHDLLIRLRSENTEIEGCSQCYYKKSCHGGLKCLSYAVYNDPFRKDPHCWI